MSPSFALLRLARCESESSLTGPRRELLLKFEHGVELELQEFAKSEPLRGLVMIRFGAIAFQEDESKAELKASAHYVAEFRYPDDAVPDEVKADFASHEHQRHLVMQAFPAAVANFRGLLASMGLPGAMLPLTPP